MIRRKCAMCACEFIPYNKNQIYCKKKCTNKAFRIRELGGVPKPQKKTSNEYLAADRSAYDWLQA